MQFKPLVFLTAALSFNQVQADLTANDVVDAIHNITDLSSGALDVAKSITPTNALPSGLKIVDDFRQIVVAVVDDVKVLQGLSSSPQFPEADQKSICSALTDFVKVHQDLLKTLIGQKGLLSATPLTEPIGAVLRILETGVDKLAAGAIALVPTCAAKAGDELKQLDGTLDEAVNAFAIKLPTALPTPIATALPTPIPTQLPTRLPGLVGRPVSGPLGGQ
ncbi:hypothetical protein ACHAQJ_006860 [Trichoderma viride]